jgi:hypothetical protein
MSRFNIFVIVIIMVFRIADFVRSQESNVVIPLEKALKPDGTFDLRKGFRRSLDPMGWRMEQGLTGEPRFVKEPGISRFVPPPILLAAGDENWDDRFSFPGSGVDGNVTALIVNGDDVYAGGGFTHAGEVAANNIAKWDGSAWSSLGNGVNGGVNAIVVSGNDVYAGGNFWQAGDVPANRIAKWDGSAWSSLGSGVNRLVWGLAVNGSDLYAGGWFRQAGDDTVNYIAKWDGSAWFTLGGGVDNCFCAMAVSGSDVYVAGTFSHAGGVAASRIAKWDGSDWASLGSGVNDIIWGIAVRGSDVYAGGMFTQAGGKSSSHIACWHETSSVYAKIKVWLEGPYQAGGSMTTALKTTGSIPLTSPYADARTVTAVPDSVTDWISVELCSLAAGPTLKQKSFFLKSNGSIVNTDGTTTDLDIPDMAAGSYFIVVRHRNHLAVMSDTAQALSSSSPLLYDFSTGLDRFYGTDSNRAKLVESGVYAMVAGDADGSGTVDASDRSATWNGRNQSGYLEADCNLSGTVDAGERSITWNNRNKSTSVP